MLISELMIPDYTAEMAMTRRLLERVPDDKLGWKPAEGGLHSIGWNASHLTDIAGWVHGIIHASELDIAADGADFTPEGTKVAVLLQKFDKNVQQSLAAFQGVPDAVMSQPWSLKMGSQTLFTMPKGDCLRKWVFGHTAHHRGILSVYLRMVGVSFSSIYEQ